MEKVKKKKERKNKNKKAAQYQGKIEPTATPSVKGNPTKKSKKTSGKRYQERIGTDTPPRGTKGTKFSGKGKPKGLEKSKGTRHRGDPVAVEQKVKGNPTKKSKKTSGEKYQQRIGNEGPPRGTKGTDFQGRSKPKTIKSSKGSNYKGDVIPLETNRVKGNPTKKIDRKGNAYRERTGSQGPPSDTPGTRFAGKGRPKTIRGGNDGTTYDGQSTAGSSSSAGGRTTIYGERGRNNKNGGVPDIKLKAQGAQWKGNMKGQKAIEGGPGTHFQGNLKGNKAVSKSPGTDYRGNLKGNKMIEGTPGTRYKGNLKLRNREVYDYGGDWAGDLKVKKANPGTKASTYAIKGMRAKELSQGPGTTYRGNLKSSKKIVNWDGADFEGHLKVKRNRKVKTEGTTYAGNLKVNPNAKVKTPGTTFAGHYKVSTRRIKTEGVDYQGDFKTSTRFFKNRQYRQKSREQQLFAGNYKVRRTKGKDLHPSATYSGGKLKDPNKRDDFSRKWKLLVAKTQKNADQPKHLKSKHKKPKYDPKENDIWND
ncbi:MAG: hypothetical protein DHS20C17_25920 [Cyclobacteriaceae bacterium]|nr:MAG: hypothetical protein DHS20C17_25920 [Cyclobacteriaceae bacterium]